MRRSRREMGWALAAALAAPAAGCGGASDYQPTGGHMGKSGHEGGGHALGADPDAAIKKITSGQGRRSATTPPGR